MTHKYVIQQKPFHYFFLYYNLSVKGRGAGKPIGFTAAGQLSKIVKIADRAL